MKLAHMPIDKVEDYIVDCAESEDNPEGSTLLDVRRGAKKWEWTRENPFAGVTFPELLTIDNRRNR